MANTHAKTHNQYKLKVDQVFKVTREGEADIFEPHADDPNRKLLWHGSRLTNWTGVLAWLGSCDDVLSGILSTGLRIAPPEAPVTGYMFDKGVYFADMVTQSRAWCQMVSG